MVELELNLVAAQQLIAALQVAVDELHAPLKATPRWRFRVIQNDSEVFQNAKGL